MRILHVIAPAAHGGIETVVLTLASAIAASGSAQALIAGLVGTSRDHSFLIEAESRGIKTEPISSRHRRYDTQVAQLRRLVLRERPSVVHTHGYHADLIGSAAAALARVPLVSTLHGFTGRGMYHRVYDQLLRLAHRHANTVIAVSPPIAAQLVARGCAASRVTTIPNAWTPSVPFEDRVRARVALGIPQDRLAIAWIGRLSAEKGPDVALAAWRMLERADAELSFIGDGPLRSSLASNTSNSPRCQLRLHGAVPGAARYLRAFDALILSSRTEGTPMVLLEAMAAGVPIVATAVGGVPHLLRDRCDALLVGADDSSALASAIDEVLANGEAASIRAASAFRRLQSEYAVEPWLKKHLEVYTSVSR